MIELRKADMTMNEIRTAAAKKAWETIRARKAAAAASQPVQPVSEPVPVPDYSARALKAKSAFIKARASEAASKEALKLYLEERGWKVMFFEGKTGSPRTGIIDAVAYRLDQKNADQLDVKLIQLKGGKAGITGTEIKRLKQAAEDARISWALAAFDGEMLQLVSEDAGTE